MTIVDTSMVVPALATWHVAHDLVRRAAKGAHVAAHVRATLVEHHQLIGRLDRQLPQENLIDERVDRRIRADAERQRQDGDRREEGTAAEAAEREPKIGEGVEHGSLDGETRPVVVPPPRRNTETSTRKNWDYLLETSQEIQ